VLERLYATRTRAILMPLIDHTTHLTANELTRRSSEPFFHATASISDLNNSSFFHFWSSMRSADTSLLNDVVYSRKVCPDMETGRNLIKPSMEAGTGSSVLTTS